MRATPSNARHMHTENQYVCFAHEGFAVAGAANENKVYVWDAKCRDQLLTLDHGGKFVKFRTGDSTDRWHRGFESTHSSGVSSVVVPKVLVALLTQNIVHVCGRGRQVFDHDWHGKPWKTLCFPVGNGSAQHGDEYV